MPQNPPKHKPQKLLCIDPATRGGLGWAVYLNYILIAWGEGYPTDVAKYAAEAEEVCFEEPEIYRARHLKGDPNLLKPLIRQIGWIEAAAWFQNNAYCEFRHVLPKEWKGQIKKVPHHHQLKRIAEANTAVVLPSLAMREKDYPNNAWDAICLGLWRLGLVTPNRIAKKGRQ